MVYFIGESNSNLKEFSDLQTKSEELKEKVEDLTTKLRYQLADAENARKRHNVELDQAKSYAITKFAKDIVEIADNLQRALETVHIFLIKSLFNILLTIFNILSSSIYLYLFVFSSFFE